MKNDDHVFYTIVTGALPDSALNIPDEKKVGVFLKLLMSLRSSLDVRNDRSYKAIVWFTSRAIDRIQATLKLCDKSEYIKDARFFGHSRHYISPRSITSGVGWMKRSGTHHNGDIGGIGVGSRFAPTKSINKEYLEKA